MAQRKLVMEKCTRSLVRELGLRMCQGEVVVTVPELCGMGATESQAGESME